MLAVEKETTLNALAVEAFNDLQKKHGKRGIAPARATLRGAMEGEDIGV